MIVSPGLTAVLRLSVLVAVRTVPTGDSTLVAAGTSGFPFGAVTPAIGSVTAAALDGAEDASDEFVDVESAEAINIITQLRHRMNATE
jgi:hypothetical protein